jgi:hypothetical protein
MCHLPKVRDLQHVKIMDQAVARGNVTVHTVTLTQIFHACQAGPISAQNKRR